MSLTLSPAEIVARAEVSGTPGLLAKAPNWSRVRLGDVARVVNGAAFPSSGFNSHGTGMPLIRIRDVGASSTRTWFDGAWQEQHLVQDGDILVGMDGDFRVATWHGGKALLNQRVCRLDVNVERYEPGFLVLVLQGYLDAIWTATSSVTVKHLSSRSIADIPLPAPPQAEQRRIVDILEDHLSRIDAADASLLRVTTYLNRLRESTVMRALTGAELPDRVPAVLTDAGTADGDLPSLPRGWSWARLGDVAEVVGGVTKDAKKQSDPTYVDVPYLRVANVQRGHLELRDVTTIRVAPTKAEALRLHPGDVLLNEGGDRDKLARGWVWEGQIDHCIHQNHVFRARMVDPRIDPYFLSWTANTFGGRWAERNGKQSVNLASISLSMIRKMPVIVPVDGESTRIAKLISEQLSSHDRLAAAVADARRRGRVLRQALLAAAFSGRLSAPCEAQTVAEETVA